MKVIEGSNRIAFLCYFGSHIPITLLCNAQGVLGPYFPKLMTGVVAWYAELSGDYLMKYSPSREYSWFSSMLCCEMLFQLPFFIVALKSFMAGGRDGAKHYPEWFRMLCIMYGADVSTTLVACIGAFVKILRE